MKTRRPHKGRQIALSVSIWLATPLASANTPLQNVVGPMEGRIGYAVTGGSLTERDSDFANVACLKPSSSASISAGSIPAGAQLVSARLFLMGSLIGNDGVDIASGQTLLFETGGLRADDPQEQDLVQALAKDSVDTQITMNLPDGETLTLQNNESYVSAFYRSNPPEDGNIAYAVVPFDVTGLLPQRGDWAGTYTVSGWTADVCRGLDTLCLGSPNATCNAISAPHSQAGAGWALVLVYEDITLPLRRIMLQEGMTSFESSTFEFTLDGAFPLPSHPQAQITMVSMEGDLRIPGSSTTAGPCAATEYVEVDGDGAPEADGLCLQDDDNPVGNIFNGTLNTAEASLVAAPSCTGFDPLQCCNGDNACGLSGVDIDSFDIAPALVAGANEVAVRMGTGTDRVGIALIASQWNLDEARLELNPLLPDAQQERLRVGSTSRVLIPIENVGNRTSDPVQLSLTLPQYVVNATVDGLSSGTVASTSDTEIVIDEIVVPPGETAWVQVSFVVSCEAQGNLLTFTARDTDGGQEALAVATGAGPGEGDCDSIDPTGPLQNTDILSTRELRGGGGCTTGFALPSTVMLLALGFFFRRRRR